VLTRVLGSVCQRHDGQDSLESHPHPFRVCHPAGAWLSKVLSDKRERFWAVVEELLRKLGTDGGNL
jgi:hypothetical protein